MDYGTALAHIRAELVQIRGYHFLADELTTTARFCDDLGICSLDYAAMVSGVERRCGFRMLNSEIGDIRTLDEMAVYIVEKTSQSAASRSGEDF